MTPREQVRERIDPRALEERTQAIGRELFAAATREHDRLSVLNRWTAQVLAWCLSDRAVKASVLRFLDVLPSLHSPREVARHVRDYFPPDARLPTALRIGAGLAGSGVLTQGALALMTRQMVEQVARQFIAERQPDAADRVIRNLAVRGATCSLDVLGEQVLSEPEADRYVAQCHTLLRMCAESYATLPSSLLTVTCGPRVNLSVKPSALTPRFDPINPTQSLEGAARRLLPLLQQAAR